MMAENDKLPVLADIYAGREVMVKENELNILLNQEPNPLWLKKHPIATKVQYIPIAIIEYLLTTIFIKWRVEIRKSELIANSAVITVRLHYKNPSNPDGEWDWQDGIGAAPLRTEKGADATDFSKVQSSAVMTGVPAAESFAIKDAAEKLGKLFGKDLNREDAMAYDSLKKKAVDVSDIKKVEQ